MKKFKFAERPWWASFRRPLALTEPIVLILLAAYVLAIHWLFLTRILDPLFHPDTYSYITPPLDRLFYHSWTLNLERTAGYPIFLYILIGLSKGFRLVVVMQHLFVLGTAAFAGTLYFRFFNRSMRGAFFVAFLSALSPEATIASHALLSDTLYAAFVVGCTFFFLAVCTNPKSSIVSWIGTGVMAGCSVLVRPIGYALVIALALIGFWKKRTRRKNLSFIGSVFLVLLSYASFNYLHDGFFGITQLGGTYAFGMAARFLDVRQVDDIRLREALIPVYARYSDSMKDGQWVRYAPEGPMPVITRLYPAPKETDRILEKLSRQAILSHPLAFVVFQAKLFLDFFRYTIVPADIYWQPEYTFFIYRGLDLAAPLAARYPAILHWLSQPPELGRQFIFDLKRTMRLPPDEAQSHLQQLYAAEPYHYSQVCLLWKPLAPLFHSYGFLAMLALAMGLWQLRQPQKQFPIVCLLSVIVVHVLIYNTGGEGVGRYAVPLEPLIWTLLIGGVGLPADKE